MARERMRKKGAVVAGTGCISAPGLTVSSAVAGMYTGMRHPCPPTRFSTDHADTYPVFEIDENEALRDLRDSGDVTLTAKLGLAAVSQALTDAGIAPQDLKGERVGVCIGTTVGCMLNNDRFYIDYKQGKNPGMTPINRFLNSNPAECIAGYYNLSGPVQTIVNACASGTDAIGVGASWIEAGICDMVIAGGTDELCKVTYNGFISLMITDTGPCKPFDRDRKGLNLGEGAGAVILLPGPDASSLSGRQKCIVSGYAAACDAHHLTAPAPDGRGLETALTTAIRFSGLDTSQVGFVNAHGTGTRDNDRVEVRILSKVLPGTPFFSTKGYTGHTLGAAGAIEAVFTIEHLLGGRIPASIGFERQDDETEQAPVRTVTDISCRAAISQSVAFGGNNAVLVFTQV